MQLPEIHSRFYRWPQKDLKKNQQPRKVLTVCVTELWWEKKKKSWHFLKFSLWFFGGPSPTPHILLFSENLLINEIPSSRVHSKPPSKPNHYVCVCVCVTERCGGECAATDKSPHREAAQQKRGASQLGRGLPVA